MVGTCCPVGVGRHLLYVCDPHVASRAVGSAGAILLTMTWVQMAGPLLGVVVGAVIAAYFSGRQAKRAERVAQERFLTERRQLAYTDFLAAVSQVSIGGHGATGTGFADVLRGLECRSVVELIAPPDTSEAAMLLSGSAIVCFVAPTISESAEAGEMEKVTDEFVKARETFTQLARRDLGSG